MGMYCPIHNYQYTKKKPSLYLNAITQLSTTMHHLELFCLPPRTSQTRVRLVPSACATNSLLMSRRFMSQIIGFDGGTKTLNFKKIIQINKHKDPRNKNKFIHIHQYFTFYAVFFISLVFLFFIVCTYYNANISMVTFFLQSHSLLSTKDMYTDNLK